MKTRATSTVFFQATAIVFAFIGMALWPPRTGPLLLVPLLQQDTGTVVTLARAGGAMLLGTGPLPGSLIVSGDRLRIARLIHRWDVIILASPSAGCGKATAWETTA